MKYDFRLNERNHWTYPEYREYLGLLIREGKTTGTDHSETMLDYTKLNETRMNRWDKRYIPSDQMKEVLAKIPSQQWVIITEGWCGDAAQNIPLLYQMSQYAPNVSFTIILRDENPDVMNDFLTNGSRSIPKLIAVDQHKEILFQWGSRPKELQELFQGLKTKGLIKEEINIEIHKIYARSQGKYLEDDFMEALHPQISV